MIINNQFKTTAVICGGLFYFIRERKVINISDTQQLKTSVTYYGTGSQTNFDFPFDYLRKAFIHVTINDVEVSDYSIDSRTIIFETAPSEGAIINIYRSTDTTRLVAWADASVLKASDMTISQVQQLHILEEGQDWSKINSIYLDENDSKWQGNNHPMKNISDPVDAKDVVTKGYMETVQGGFVMTNTALKDEAAKQAGIATTKASEAAASASAAATSETNAASSANTAKRWAEASDSPDNTTSKSAKTWASEAAGSSSAAKTSETNAKSSETKAANSATTATEKAGIATTKASEASASASAAKTSETNAQNAASAAASSQADAANSAAEAAGAAALITFPIAIENGGTGATTAKQARANLEVEPIGTIYAFAGNDIPTGYLPCNGSAISRETYADLFAVIGTTYGSGDGSTTFNLPNLTDKFIQGSDTAGTVKSAGLPNISGTVGAFVTANKAGPGLRTGVFKQTLSGSEIARSGPNSSLGNTNIVFYASDSNSIYGNSTTVQPPALTMRYIIKY